AMNVRPFASLQVCLGIMFCVARLAPAAELYVATHGSDLNPGTKGKPFASLERARDAIRKLRQDLKLPAGPVTIWIRGGDYVRTNAFELSPEDSGTPETPIVWRASKGQTVRLLGGRKLDGF